MRHVRIAAAIALLSIGLCTTGCIAFRSGDLAPVSIKASSLDPKPSIAVTVTGKWREMQPTPQPLTWSELQRSTEVVLEAYRESGLFSEVRAGFFEADLRATVELHRVSEPNPFFIFAIMTLTVIPAYASGDYDMKTTFLNRDLEEIESIERREGVSQWIGLLLAPLAPFWGTGGVYQETVEDLVRSTLAGAGSVLQAAAETREPSTADGSF